MAIPNASTTCPACRTRLINGECPNCGPIFPDQEELKKLVIMDDIGRSLIFDWPPEVAAIDGIPEVQAIVILKKYARSVLIAEEESLMTAVGEFEQPWPAGGTGNGADEANDAKEAATSKALLQLFQYRLQEINSAFRRCQEGRWGRCEGGYEECSGWISALRLFCDPTARHCISCARKLGR